MKRKLIIILSSIILSFAIIVPAVYGAFMFTRTINGSTELGQIKNITKGISIKTIEQETVNGKQQDKYVGDNLVYTTDSEGNKVYTDLKEEDGTTNKSSVTCYLTKKNQTYDQREYPYFNQIKCSFSFENEIDVYVRVLFQQAWVSHKIYRTGVEDERYMPYDSNVVYSAVDMTTWKYDASTGYLYLKQKVEASTELHEFNFEMSDSYFLQVENNANYHESRYIDFSFKVEICQANRASKAWEVDVETLLAS